ncbi:Gfo/Idh/MocA family protein [Rhodococcus sp. OK302]|uniref:Gfo/Idh/MocA family protein n=1 Tax=Rhodococcus sp. OK302 TaxID=1882769 RepID=UPI001C3E804A|nr:Gfo/Idh/MocA family oxidoreductase [Rhodococcus sp. OK302]
MLSTEPGLDLHLMTRDGQKLDRISDTYRVQSRTSDLDALIATGIRAAFVHVSTDQHHEIVVRRLRAGVDVFVDKPLSYDLAESRYMVELARGLSRSLMVGFNRRYAPSYVEALAHPRDLVILQKDRRDGMGDVRTSVLDDFIHLVDTLRMLAPHGAHDIDVQGKTENGKLHHVVLRLAETGFTGLAVMNRSSGSAGEILQTAGAGHRREVVNLGDVIEHDRAPKLLRGSDWEPVGRRRGIEGACRHFLQSVRDGTTLDAEDALTTHEWCEDIITRLTTP